MMRQSDAPSWAIALGLGTHSESIARSVPTKITAWSFWIALHACALLLYGVLFDELEVSALVIAICLLVSAFYVLLLAALLKALCRWKDIE